jgi:FKBP-type peptidyl-prolyl cis-trans isomerase
LATFADSASYALGMNMGGSIRMAKDRIQREALIRGLTDALDEKEPVLAEQDAMRVLRQFATQVQEADQRNRAAEGDVNRTSGDEFRAGNAARPGVQTTASGLQVEVLQAGTGARPTVTDRVTVHYRGTLIDGTEFDSSYKRGEPATFPVGQIIPGWTEALQMMNVGGKYKIVIPPDLAYGADGAPPDIGPNATLVFEIELVGIAQ